MKRWRVRVARIVLFFAVIKIPAEGSVVISWQFVVNASIHGLTSSRLNKFFFFII